jgi:hypothetical protein
MVTNDSELKGGVINTHWLILDYFSSYYFLLLIIVNMVYKLAGLRSPASRDFQKPLAFVPNWDKNIFISFNIFFHFLFTICIK